MQSEGRESGRPEIGARIARALGHAWYRGIDYAWALREIARGLADPGLPLQYASGSAAPVLLLPGVLENWTMMRGIASRLNAAGHPIHALHELGRNTVTVPEASALGTAYLLAEDLNRVILVAHSKGGLIGKHMMLGGEGHRIDRLVAVSTPFGGSGLARLIPHPVISAFDPRDATIVDLAARSEVNERIVSIYPEFDPHIPGGSRLEGARNVALRSAGHFRVLGDPAVISAVLDAVSDVRP